MHLFLEGSKEWRDGDERVCPVYRSGYMFGGMMWTFAKGARLLDIDSREDCYELSSHEAQDELIKLRLRHARSVHDDVNNNIATNVKKTRMYNLLADGDYLDIGGAVGLEEVERVGIKRRF